jgi:hypothetical protein
MRAWLIAVAFLGVGCGSADASGLCSTNADCAAGLVCDYGSSRCRAPVRPDAGAQPCTSDAECASGLCQSGSCACTQDTWTSYASGALSAHCGGCHGWASSFGTTASNSTGIRANLESGAMPLNGTLPQSDRDRLVRWIDCGMPQ